MSDVVYFVASSLDGYIADARSSLDWLTGVDSDDVTLAADFMATVGVQVMGSSTYEWLLAHEDLLEQPEKWEQFFGVMPTVVFSSRDLPTPNGADVRVVAGPVAPHMPLLRQRADGRVIWVVGGGVLAAQFLVDGLLDRVEVTYAPAVLGSGVPLLPARCDPGVLRLRDVAKHGPFMHATYDVVGDRGPVEAPGAD